MLFYWLFKYSLSCLHSIELHRSFRSPPCRNYKADSSCSLVPTFFGNGHKLRFAFGHFDTKHTRNDKFTTKRTDKENLGLTRSVSKPRGTTVDTERPCLIMTRKDGRHGARYQIVIDGSAEVCFVRRSNVEKTEPLRSF